MFLLGFAVGLAVCNCYWFAWATNRHRKLEKKYGKLELP